MITFDKSLLTYDQFRVLMGAIEADQALDKAARKRMAGAGGNEFRAQLLILQGYNIESAARQLFQLGWKTPMSFGDTQRLVKREIETRREELKQLIAHNEATRAQMEKLA